MKDPTLITKVALKNYKGIASCDVTLGPLTFLVGPNGAGKSNFLDALRFVADSLHTSLDHAFRDRGGIKEVRRRSGGHPTHFAIHLDFRLRSGHTGRYGFRIGARPQETYEVQDEDCFLQGPNPSAEKVFFKVRSGRVTTNFKVAPPASVDRLYLLNASGLPEFRAVYESLSRMGFYNLNPARIRALQQPHAGDLLARDGGNIASVLAQLDIHAKGVKTRIENYLAKVVPGVNGVVAKRIGHMETLEFKQQVAGSKNPWAFLATNMSDGTLRALGILVALFQSGNGKGMRVPLVGIEEPEIALHPAAAGVILDSLRDASRNTQVLVTSHSPDLLDDRDFPTNSLLAVVAKEGKTTIGHLDEAGRSALHDRLYTAGELLRLNQLVPDSDEIKEASREQVSLFDGT